MVVSGGCPVAPLSRLLPVLRCVVPRAPFLVGFDSGVATPETASSRGTNPTERCRGAERTASTGT